MTRGGSRLLGRWIKRTDRGDWYCPENLYRRCQQCPHAMKEMSATVLSKQQTQRKLHGQPESGGSCRDVAALVLRLDGGSVEARMKMPECEGGRGGLHTWGQCLNEEHHTGVAGETSFSVPLSVDSRGYIV